MRKFRQLLTFGLFLLLLTTYAAAAPPTVTFTLTGNGSGANLAGVYTSPYAGSISGIGTNLPVICDDFVNNSYIPEQWTAYVTSLSALNTSSTISSNNENKTVFWGTGTGTSNQTAADEVYGAPAGYSSWALSQGQAYEAAALLTIDILNAGTGTTAQEEYSYALWELFAAGPTTNTSGSITDPTTPLAQLAANQASGDIAAVMGYLESAISEVQNGTVTTAQIGVKSNITLSSYLNNYNVTVYTYDSGAVCGQNLNQNCSTAPPQEFLTVTPMAEPQPLAMLGLDLLGAAGILVFTRRRRGQRRMSTVA